MSLTKHDLRQIGEVVERTFDRKFDENFKRNFDTAFDQKFDEKFRQNFNTAFDQKFDEKFDQKFTSSMMSFWETVIEPNMASKADLETGLNSLRIELKKDNQDTRDYVDRRINELSGTMVMYDKAILGKVDKLVDTLEHKQIFNANESTSIKQLSPFTP